MMSTEDPIFVEASKAEARNNNEIRLTSPTGGQKGQKPQQPATLDPLALLSLSEVSGFGAQKYEAFNYLRGYDWSLSYDAVQRHLMLFWAGQNHDEESGLLHVAHAAWHCLALTSFSLRGVGTDNRPPYGSREAHVIGLGTFQ